jgi:hypothetical protein
MWESWRTCGLEVVCVLSQCPIRSNFPDVTDSVATASKYTCRSPSTSFPHHQGRQHACDSSLHSPPVSPFWRRHGTMKGELVQISDAYNHVILLIYSLNLNQPSDSDSMNPLNMILNLIQLIQLNQFKYRGDHVTSRIFTAISFTG